MKQQCKNHQGLVLLYRIYSGSGSPSPLPRLACFTTVQRQSPLPELALTIDPPPLLDFCASPELCNMVGIAVGPFSPLPCSHVLRISRSSCAAGGVWTGARGGLWSQPTGRPCLRARRSASGCGPTLANQLRSSLSFTTCRRRPSWAVSSEVVSQSAKASPRVCYPNR